MPLQTNFIGPPRPPVPTLPSDTWPCDRCRREAVRSGPDSHSYCDDCYRVIFSECSNCHHDFNARNSIIANEAGNYFCPECYNRIYVDCQNCGRELRRATVGPGCLCDRCHARRFFHCNDCGRESPITERHRNPDGDYRCGACFNDSCCSCSDCGEPIWNDDVRHVGDRPYCGGGCYRHAHSEWEMGAFVNPDPTFTVIGSTRKFGIELETSECPNHHDLHEHTIWECKHDCSIEGMEFVSPILYGDEGLMEIVNFCKVARDKGFRVNRSCGYHAHFDVSSESEDSLKSIAYAYRKTYSMWNDLVPENRSDNRMCGSPDYIEDDIVREDWDYFVGKRDRFEFVNWRSYLLHGSCEVRLYQGTLDAEEICNWIELHARFIDFVSKMTFAEIDTMFHAGSHTHFVALTNIIGNALGDYWAQKSHVAGKHIRRLVDAEPVRRSIRSLPRRLEDCPVTISGWQIDTPTQNLYRVEFDPD